MGDENTAIPDPNARIPDFPIPVPMVLAFRLVGVSGIELPERIGRALQKPEVRKAIEKGGNDVAAKIARDSLWNSPSTMTEKEKSDLFDKVMAANTNPLKTDVWAQIQASAGARRLGEGLQSFARDIDTAAGGVFTDKGWVYIVGAAVGVLASGVGMWSLRSGDVVAKPITSLGGKLIPHKTLGALDIGAEFVKFEPENHQIQAKFLTAFSWERVQTKFSLTGSWSDGSSGKVSGTGQIIIPLGYGVSVSAAGKAGGAAKDTGYALGWTFSDGRVDLSLWATYGPRAPLGPHRPNPQQEDSGAAVFATASFHF